MFKKKGNNNKKIDLAQETEQISVSLPAMKVVEQENRQGGSECASEQPSVGFKPAIVKHKVKHNLFSLEGMEKPQNQPSKLTEMIFNNRQEKVANSEIQQCFTELRKMKEKEIITQEQQRYEENHQEKPEKLVIRVQNVDLQSQPEGLEIEVDEQGGLSPELNYGRTQDYDDLNGDYEDELIRKTLTKRNYDNLSKNGGISLSSLKKNQANDSLVQKLKKVNANMVRKAIQRDLYNKKLKLKELNDNLQSLTSHGGNKKNQILQKEKRLKGLKDQLANLIQVIEYIYYYGDKVKQFSISSIKKQIAEQEASKNNYHQQSF